MQKFKFYIFLIFKGMAMGAANVIPGVSGGTIALITEIFERLINAIKSFDLHAVKLLFTGKFKEFTKYTDLYFLLAILLGVVIAIVSLAKVFDFLFSEYPTEIWAFFFGLVLASVFYVGRRISKVSPAVITTFIIGTAIAVYISFLGIGQENNNFFYLVLCGVAAICSMILPGLSGSFVLLIMGNYKLVAIDAINDKDLGILLPVMIGAVGGLIAFSHILSWVFKKFRDETISILTGFIMGSLSILWPWQIPVYMKLESGEQKISHYTRTLPEQIDMHFWIAIVCIILGFITIWAIEKMAKNKA